MQQLPSVHEVIESLMPTAKQMPHSLVLAVVRRAIQDAREGVGETTPSLACIQEKSAQILESWRTPSLRRVINATGVVLHTNLGRAPLASFAPVEGYSNLEFELSTGKRGKRDVHTGRLLRQILGAPAIVVNNGAAALFLVLNEIAAGGEAVVSRGELIEIGEGFRIPDIMERSGAVLREVGTTNRTTIEDYRNAIHERTRVLLRVHPSNFRITGFTARPELAELTALGKQRGIPVYEDLGSGCLADLSAFGIDEPTPQSSLRQGVDLVSFSGDKLLGGPQGGIIAGREELVQRIRKNPLFRALRQDKLFYQAMEQTLRHMLMEEWDALPALRMIRLQPEEIRERSERFATKLPFPVLVEKGESVIGGGSTPDKSLPTYLTILNGPNAADLEKRLRLGAPPVLARIERDRVVFDLRTVSPEEEADLARAVAAAYQAV